MKRVLVILLLGLVLGGVGAGVFLMRGKLPQVQGSTAKPKKEKTELITLEERVVNLADKPSSHYLKINVAIEVAGSGDVKKVSEEKTPLLMDRLIGVLSQYSYATLLVPEGKAKAKDELVKAFKQCLEDSDWEAKEVLFTNFVME
ncbi:MAG TPA: flagellar basal body-associated FliL family protein [Armatimonadota bacterium]|jgi:flagellar basal body-associated protein FliL